jgi:SET domain-containing protein
LSESYNNEQHIFVKESNIHGAGLFTSINISAGSTIMLIKGEAISEEECIIREDEGNVYIFWNEDNYIDTSSTEKIKYINHNCDYNCDVIDGGPDYLVLVASREILVDEELTIDYGYEEIYDYCNCNLCTAQVAL